MCHHGYMAQSSTDLFEREPFNFPGHGENSRTGVLLCHGFTGSPQAMLPWARSVAAAGYAVSVPRLEGHGTQWKDLKHTTWQAWYASLETAYRELAETCDQVFAFGLSMGGALSLRLASQYPLAGLVLVNPGLVIAQRAADYAGLLKFIVASTPSIGGNIKKPDQDEQAYPRTAVAAVAQLHELFADTVSRLAEIDTPLLLFRSTEDTVVNDISVETLLTGITSAQRAQTRVVWLEHSFHVATLDNDAPLIESGSLDFLAAHTRLQESREHS